MVRAGPSDLHAKGAEGDRAGVVGADLRDLPGQKSRNAAGGLGRAEIMGREVLEQDGRGSGLTRQIGDATGAGLGGQGEGQRGRQDCQADEGVDGGEALLRSGRRR